MFRYFDHSGGEYIALSMVFFICSRLVQVQAEFLRSISIVVGVGVGVGMKLWARVLDLFLVLFSPKNMYIWCPPKSLEYMSTVSSTNEIRQVDNDSANV